MGEHSPLLELQRLDTSADRLHALREALPERTSLRECDGALEALVQTRADAGQRRTELGREERRVDGLRADLEARAREVEGTLYSGKVKVLKELEALQEELRSFQRRQREREDEELVVMEREEQLEHEIAEMEARRVELEAQGVALRAAIEMAEAQIGSELEAIATQRDRVVPQVPAELLVVYDKLRGVPRLEGLGAVPIESRNCGGCRMALPTALFGRIQREPNEIAQCPGCSRILVL
jgi:predicted  nucleic acid-binding Zn-ribbon protein